MIFEGTISVDHSKDKVWDFVLDVHKFSSCMPGLDSIDQIDETTFDGVITAKVGPISGSFNFRSSIVDSHPKESLRVSIDGKDSVTGSTINASVDAQLDEPQANHTDMSYKADVEIKGRLAILGDMILRATTSLILDEFTKRLRKALDEENSSR